jgi:hypothetical protein
MKLLIGRGFSSKIAPKRPPMLGFEFHHVGKVT